MRTEKAEIGTVVYPEKLVFAFNPTPIEVFELSTNDPVTIEVGLLYTDTRYPSGRSVKIDISKYLQMYVRPNKRSDEEEVTITANGKTFSFDLLIIWGAINVGETFNAGRTVQWFKNMPFTFGMYVPDDGTVKTRYDRMAYVSQSYGTGIVEVDMSSVFSDATDFAVIRMDSEEGGVFDLSFDGTFGNKQAEAIYRFVVNECTDGIYLRWIDRHGFMNYYLFDEGEQTQVDKSMGEISAYHMDAYKYKLNLYQGKEVERSIKIGAPLADNDTFRQLMTLATSPVVELYVGDDQWLRVNVKPMTITKGNKPLNDMEFVLDLPDLMTQRL